jgi:hypothetical protein
VKISRRNLSLLAWTGLASVLYFVFGLAASGSFVRLLGGLGVVEHSDRVLAGDIASAGFGPLLLGLSWVYRHSAGRENAGSMAAWLAGWALLLLGFSQALGRFSPALVPVLFGVLLALWVARRVLSAYRSRGDQRL